MHVDPVTGNTFGGSRCLRRLSTRDRVAAKTGAANYRALRIEKQPYGQTWPSGAAAVEKG